MPGHVSDEIAQLRVAHLASPPTPHGSANAESAMPLYSASKSLNARRVRSE
jgi:hypothetical protein